MSRTSEAPNTTSEHRGKNDKYTNPTTMNASQECPEHGHHLRPCRAHISPDEKMWSLRASRGLGDPAAEAAFGVDDLAGDQRTVVGGQPGHDASNLIGTGPAASGQC